MQWKMADVTTAEVAGARQSVQCIAHRQVNASLMVITNVKGTC